MPSEHIPTTNDYPRLRRYLWQALHLSTQPRTQSALEVIVIPKVDLGPRLFGQQTAWRLSHGFRPQSEAVPSLHLAPNPERIAAPLHVILSLSDCVLWPLKTHLHTHVHRTELTDMHLPKHPRTVADSLAA